MKNVGEKLTDEEAEKMIKQIDIDDAQQSKIVDMTHRRHESK